MKLFKILLALLSITVLSACTVPVLYKDTLHENCKVERSIARAHAYDSVAAQHVKINTNFYAHDVYRSGQSPQWLYSRVNLRASSLPLDLLMTKMLPVNTVTAQYEAGADKNRPITLNHAGTILGALDAVSAKTGYAYNIQDNMITWSTMVTKTFDISFMPGASQYLMGQKQGDTMLSSSAATGATGDSQFSSLEGNLSVWKDLEESVKGMLSPEGKVMVSQSTTTITVQDHPQNVQKVADYLASMNSSLSREVSLQVKVLEVNLDKNFNYGIDWNLAYNTAAKTASGIGGLSTGDLSQAAKFSNLGNNAAAGPITPIGGATPLGIPGISAGIASGPFKNSTLLINALAQQGSVSTVTNPEVVTLNNQVAQIDISKQTSYLASMTTTLQGQGSNMQTSLTPGVVNTGFKLYILPKIMNHNVYLQISSELSTLDKIEAFGPKDASGNLTSQIQLPTISGKHFNLRSVVPSGDTLIIAGFKQANNTANKASMFGADALGGKGADQNNVETIVLITPTLIGNKG